MHSRRRGSHELRMLVLPPTHADGLAIGKVLRDSGIAAAVVRRSSELCEALDEGAGGVIISEESLLADTATLLPRLAEQPVWSDIPLIVLSKFGRESSVLSGIVSQMGSVSVAERPMRMSTLLSLVRSCLRARERQYQVRDFLHEREQLLESERTARAEAERAGRAKDEFLATLSHELRTPLNAVLGWTRVLRKSRGLTEELANGLAVIERNARSQAQIIGDLLDMSRIMSGKVRLELRPVDLLAIVQATVETVKPTAEAKDIELTTSLVEGPVPVHADPNRLQQVLWNLLTNAIKFTRGGGHVKVSVARDGATARIELVDDGEGIAPDVLPYIFDRFRQADASSSRRHGGLGLGLSIVRQLTELHGGTITAFSRGLGTGSTFRLALPVMTSPGRAAGPAATDSAAREQVATPDELPHVNLRGLRVLVVDDEPDARALLERLLQDCEASVIAAGSADEALRLLDEDPLHLIVSDIGMPGTDGYTLVRQIRARADGRATIPAIALTAYVRSEDHVRALDAGFQCHLPKPVDPAALLRNVERLGRERQRGDLPGAVHGNLHAD